MSDIFSLFDGKMGAGSAASISAQSVDSFSDVSTENDLIARLASGSDMASLAVDYSDFANFVTFNSAESYVNVTADQIINDYPYDGSVDDLQAFIDSLDGYQRYFLGRWPSRIGHLRFNPSVSASYVKIDDLGAQDGVSRTSFVSPGTGSLSIQGWIGVPLNTSNAIVVFQKEKNSENKISVFAQGSTLSFQVISGSTLWTVTASLSEMPTFFSAVIDRSSTTGSVSLYTATTGTFPVLRNTTEMLSSTRFDLASGSFYIGSGSLTTTTTEAFTGSVDDISVWNVPRGLTELTSSFNRKVYGQSGLVGLWRFNEASDATPRSYAAVVRDNAGHRLDGRIQEYYPALRGSGSLSNDTPDPILSLEDEDVIDYIVDAQSSGTIYDRGNGSMIFNLFPEAFSQNSETFQNFTLIMARFFDRIKLYINQLPNLHRVGYSDYDNAPDDLLDDVGALYGWKLDGNFATADALKYFVGRDVSGGTQGNISIDTKLVDIKSRFWRRVLQNLMYVYKTKGTRESVEALLRIYGVNNNFVKLKEYARKAEARIPVSRAVSEKSVYSLAFGLSGSSGSISGSGFSVGSSGDFSAELRVKFPGPTSDEIPPTQLSGELVTFFSSSLAVVQPESVLRLFYEKSSVASLTGNIFLTSSSGRITHSSASIFDGNFYNISVVRETATGSITLATMRYESDIEMHSSSTFSFSGYPSTSFNGVKIGSYSGTLPEFYGQEFRAWDDSLEAIELLDHAKNFESYGRSKSINNEDLKVHWRLNDGAPSASGTFSVYDSTENANDGLAINFTPGVNSFIKSLLSQAVIPSIDSGWNQEKVRVYDGSNVPVRDRYEDERFLSLEFNMYDALNEDISHLIASYDELNNILGHPMNRYRADYEGLQQMRETYFKRLQGQLNFKEFVNMLDFFDSSFVTIVQRLIPARSIFKGDELVVESHMLERPKYQYGFRPIREGILEISGSISLVDRNEDWP